MLLKQETKNGNISKTLFKLSFFAFILSVFAQMYFANSTAVKSRELNELNERKTELQKEIAYLEFEVSKVSSLSYIEEKALALGFEEMQGTVLAVRPAPTVSAAAVPAF